MFLTGFHFPLYTIDQMGRYASVTSEKTKIDVTKRADARKVKQTVKDTGNVRRRTRTTPEKHAAFMRAFVDVLSARQETPSKIPYSATPYKLCHIYETGKVKKGCFWRDVALKMNGGEKKGSDKLREWAQKHYENSFLNHYAD